MFHGVISFLDFDQAANDCITMMKGEKSCDACLVSVRGLALLFASREVCFRKVHVLSPLMQSISVRLHKNSLHPCGSAYPVFYPIEDTGTERHVAGVHAQKNCSDGHIQPLEAAAPYSPGLALLLPNIDDWISADGRPQQLAQPKWADGRPASCFQSSTDLKGYASLEPTLSK